MKFTLKCNTKFECTDLNQTLKSDRKSHLSYSYLETQSMNQAEYEMFLYKSERENLFVSIFSRMFLS